MIKGYFWLFLLKNIWRGHLLGDPKAYPQHIFSWRTDENDPSIIKIRYPCYLFQC